MIRKALVTFSLALIFGSASLAEAGPPVKVEVVVEDEDDFFEEKKAKPKNRVEEVREHANEMFDELSKEEAKHKNDNTNVVNVVVVDGEKKEEHDHEVTPVVPDVPAVTVVPDRPLSRAEIRELRRAEKLRQRHELRMQRLAEKEERRQQKLRYREEKLRLRHQELQMREDLRCQRLEHRGWWNRPSWAEEGDFLVHGVMGFNGRGPFGGFGAEYFATDMLGVRAGAQFMRLHQDDDVGFTGPNFNINRGGVWANANSVDYRNLQSGSTHLIDAVLAVHVIPRSRFDIYPTAGFGYMGYDFNYNDHEEKGGAGYFRLGMGFNIVIKRFYLGMDFGWYPLELFHHGTRPNSVATLDASLLPDEGGEGEGEDRDRNNDDADDDGDGRSRWNAKRMTLTAHVGFRF